jgi:hypothetical protein
MANLTINIDMGKKCAECGKGGAVDSGICLACTTKVIKGKPMKSPIGRAVAARFKNDPGRPVPKHGSGCVSA